MCPERVLRAFVTTSVALALLAPAGADGYDFKLVPSVQTSGEYNNNLFFTENDKENDWLLSVMPKVETTYSTERFNSSFSGYLDWLKYRDHTDLDSTDFGFSGLFGGQASERLRLNATLAFRKESRTDRHFEEAGQVDQANDYRHDYGIGAEWLISEKTAATASYRFEFLDYPTYLHRDSKIHTVDFGILRGLSWWTADTKGRVDVGFSRGDYEELTTDTFMLTVGVIRAVHELWIMEVNLGGMYVKSDFAEGSGFSDSNDFGFLGNAAWKYKGERTNAKFEVKHELAPSYGSEGAAVRTAAVVTVERGFLYNLFGTLSAGYYINTADPGQYSTQKIDERSAQIRPGIRWKQSKYLQLEASYRYSRTDDRASDTSASQSAVFAAFTLSYPLFDR